MRLPWRVAVSMMLLMLTSVVFGDGVTPVPSTLDSWRGWVLHDHEVERCPQLGSAEDAIHACRWPGELQLDADANGLRFVQTWTLYAPQRVPLPGSGRWRPIEVEVDGRSAAVVLDDTGPRLDLDIGTHRVAGLIPWAQRPATLPLPSDIAWVTLRVDGAAVPLPQRNEDGELVLGATAGDESDALQIEAYRLLADGAPPWLATRIVLSVAGKPRELVLGPILPPGYVPVALDGEVPLRWESDGRLRVQVRPGSWALTVIARAPAATNEFVWPAVPEPWATQELWQFRAAPNFRIAQLEGLPGIDPEQAGAPQWREGLGEATTARWGWLFDAAEDLPAYLFGPGAKATLEVSLRGLPTHRPPRLNLSRELWLDFDGGEFIARDRVTGEIGGAARLDMRAPWNLEQARRDGEQNLLITRGADATLSGIEWRDTEVDLESGARVERRGALPASGWAQPFDSASAVLHLPPGYRLFAARGADRAEGSWMSRWDLLDMFLASIVVLLAWRVPTTRRDVGSADRRRERLQPLLAALLLGWLLWSWHEPDAPRLSLLLLLGLSLALRYVPPGRWQRLLSGARYAMLAVVAVWSLLFAATQLRLAIYPQLEHGAVSAASSYESSYASDSEGLSQEVEMTVARAPQPASAPPPEKRMANGANQAIEQVQVAGSRLKNMDLYQYPTDAIPQAGNARPDWQWHRHQLTWNGPLLPDETLDLWVSPPWLTRLLRVLAVLMLGGALALLLRRASVPTKLDAIRTAPAATLGAVLLALTLSAMPSHANAQATPDPAMLDALRERLLARVEPCQPECAGLAVVNVRRDGENVVLALDAHAQAEVAWPLPQAGEGQSLVGLSVDGAPAPVLQGDEGAWIHLLRGVHRVELTLGSDEGRWRIAFPLPPASLVIQQDDFEISGLDEDRLIGDTLELVAKSIAADSGDDASGDTDVSQSSEAVPPFVRVRRALTFDQQWQVRTTVQRIAPERGGLTVAVPLLAGELPFDNAPPLREGQALVSLAAGAEELTWVSRLNPADSFELIATETRGFAEEWQLNVAPLLHVEAQGLPEAGPEDSGVRRFLPLPGERLKLIVTRPLAIEGATLAIENVNLQVTPGQRARDSRLEFTLRSTRAGQHLLALPNDSELLGLWVNGEEQPRVLNEGKIALPLRSAPQQIVLTWRELVPLGLHMRSPALDLGASAANLRIQLKVPEERWLLLASGPGVGPAVLYWSQLAVLLLVAWGLARIGGTPLRFHHWLLLGLGFSTVSWLAAVIVAGWLLLLGWRGRRTDSGEGYGFALLQIVLAFVTLVALLCLIAAVPAGLLGTPDMQVTGNGSSGGQLNWFLDRSAGAVPQASAWSLPMWAYQIAILLWALWLANALLGWLRWGWMCFGAGGRWRWPRRMPTNMPLPNASVAAAEPAIEGRT